MVKVPEGGDETVMVLPTMQAPELMVPLGAIVSGQAKPLFWAVP